MFARSILTRGYECKVYGNLLASLIRSRVDKSSNIPDIFVNGSTVDRLIRAGRYEEVWEYCNAPSRSDAMAWVLNGFSIVTYK